MAKKILRLVYVSVLVSLVLTGGLYLASESALAQDIEGNSTAIPDATHQNQTGPTVNLDFSLLNGSLFGGGGEPEETREVVGLELSDEVVLDAVVWSRGGGYARFEFDNSADSSVSVAVSDSVQIGSINSGTERANARVFRVAPGESSEAMGLMVERNGNMKVVIDAGVGEPYVVSNPSKPLIESVTGWTVLAGTLTGALVIWLFGEALYRILRWWHNSSWTRVA